MIVNSAAKGGSQDISAPITVVTDSTSPATFSCSCCMGELLLLRGCLVSPDCSYAGSLWDCISVSVKFVSEPRLEAGASIGHHRGGYCGIVRKPRDTSD